MSAPAPAPLVSVVVPTYNRLPLLRETVASVLVQTRPDWELVVVDDGSDDGTAEWVRSIGDARVRLIALPHAGNLARARNAGNAAARGELIALLDSDDLFEPDKLERQVAELRAHPECGWSFTSMSLIDAAGRPLDGRSLGQFTHASGWILEELLRFRVLVDTPSVMVRRELLDRVGGFDEGLDECQDYELFFRLAAVSPAAALDLPLTRKRIHPGSLNADRTRVNEAWITVYERFGSRSRDPAVRRACAQQAWQHRLSAASSRVRGRGDLGGAARHAARALARRPWSPRGWRTVADVLLTAVARRWR